MPLAYFNVWVAVRMGVEKGFWEVKGCMLRIAGRDLVVLDAGRGGEMGSSVVSLGLVMHSIRYWPIGDGLASIHVRVRHSLISTSIGGRGPSWA
jgi:hypothetical protein